MGFVGVSISEKSSRKIQRISMTIFLLSKIRGQTAVLRKICQALNCELDDIVAIEHGEEPTPLVRL